MSTTSRFSPRLKEAVRTTDTGIAMRGNWILRTSASRSTTEPTAPPVPSRKKVKSTMFVSSDDGIEVDGRADLDELGEDDVEHAEEQQRAHQLPEVAERGAEEAQLELGHRQGGGEVHEAPRVAAERRRPADGLQLRGRRGRARGRSRRSCRQLVARLVRRGDGDVVREVDHRAGPPRARDHRGVHARRRSMTSVPPSCTSHGVTNRRPGEKTMSKLTE